MSRRIDYTASRRLAVARGKRPKTRASNNFNFKIEAIRSGPLPTIRQK